MIILIFSFLFLIFVNLISLSKPNSIINNKYTKTFFIMLMLIFSSIWIGYKDVNMFPDSLGYSTYFLLLKNISLMEALDIINYENAFIILQWVVNLLDMPIEFNFLIIYLVFIIIFIVAIYILFNHYSIYFVFLYIYFPFFITLGGNILRQGLSISFLLLSISILIRYKKKTIYFFISALFASFFHYTALPLILILVVVNIFKIKMNHLIYIWIFLSFSFFMKLPNILTNLLIPISYINSYISESSLNNYGNQTYRMDFYLFGAFFLLFGLITNKYVFNYKDRIYTSILKIYIIFNCYFLILGFISYSDRVAIFSWILIPMIMIYPLLILNKKIPLVYPAFATLIFILFLFLNGRYY
ncbi:EpsG family protein [Paenisporosarcina macmurdoensis]|uniref:EpsG family protein n=1 Tax=Paenisporosarcina macmurdoensis TaxID=212659 RepID=A0ABW1LAV8_9BACL